MHPKKITNVLSLDAQSRHGYFVRKVADAECVWGLERFGWAMTKDDAGRTVVPFWPEEDFAKLCRQGSWKDYTPKRIELRAFLDRWLPGMRKDGVLVAIFPKPDDRGIVADPKSLRDAIETELSQYE